MTFFVFLAKKGRTFSSYEMYTNDEDALRQVNKLKTNFNEIW